MSFCAPISTSKMWEFEPEDNTQRDVPLYETKSEPMPIPGSVQHPTSPVRKSARGDEWVPKAGDCCGKGECKCDGRAGNKATFSTESVLTAADRATQQMIFDRLPLSKSKRQEFYKWLLGEHDRERRSGAVADDGAGEDDDEGNQGSVQQQEVDGHGTQGSD